MTRVDFHMHTTHSDGSYAPAELIRYCKVKGLGCVSVTDHDTMSSFEECDKEARELGIELIPGVEISAQFEPGTLHILGFFLDRHQPKLKAVLDEIQKARRERNPQIIQKLNALGIEISMKEVVEEAYANTEGMADKQIGRPHFAKVLLKKGAVKSLEEAFDKYLGKGKPAYVDKRRVTSEEAIGLINQAGGIASVAHPKQMKLAPDTLEKEIGKLVDQGLGAIEVYNSCQRPYENAIYQRIAKRFNLVETGGSDFHGANKPDVDLGFLGENVNLGYSMVESLRERIAKRSGGL